MVFKVFICHAYDHREIYSDLVTKLNDARHFDWRNVSIQYDMRFGSADDEVDDAGLRSEVGKRIAECDAFLVLTKPIVARRRWLQWEIARAKELGKPIIGIARRKNDRVSLLVRQEAIDIVDTWRSDHIAHAIKGYVAEYRSLNKTSPVLAALPPLPEEVKDEEVTPEPTPLAPDEIAEVEPPSLSNSPFSVKPKDVLFGGRNPLEAMSMPAGLVKRPRWWWPFATKRQ